jgi:predicted acylesterase/phospholipase RssA
MVIWDMGAIASEGTPDSLELYRKVLLASASVPGFFPPVPFDIERGGRKYRELHADGGVTASLFLRPYMLRLDPDNLAARIGSKLYVISSGKLFPDPEPVEPSFSSVSTNAITSLLYAMTRKDVFVLYNLALLTGMDFNLIAIPDNEPAGADSLAFDPQEMRKLFDLGYRMGVSGSAWRKAPPEVERQELSLPRTGLRAGDAPANSGP